jgi:hypothetical protein
MDLEDAGARINPDSALRELGPGILYSAVWSGAVFTFPENGCHTSPICQRVRGDLPRPTRYPHEIDRWRTTRTSIQEEETLVRRTIQGAACALFAALLLGCASTPDSRIAESQELFDTYSAEVQARLRAGTVAVGDTEDMVYMALGDPDETSLAVEDDGETRMWGYTKSRPGFSIGIGGGNMGYGGGMGGGASMGSGPKRNYTAIIEFREGLVTRARYFTQ